MAETFHEGERGGQWLNLADMSRAELFVDTEQGSPKPIHAPRLFSTATEWSLKEIVHLCG